jgi:hypothetical protein
MGMYKCNYAGVNLLSSDTLLNELGRNPGSVAYFEKKTRRCKN